MLVTQTTSRRLRLLRWVLARKGFGLVHLEPSATDRYLPTDLGLEVERTFAAVTRYTMTGIERVQALVNASRYVVAANIQGAIVECGVWKGGSMMAVARTLLECGASDRELWLFDTFSGLTEPTNLDASAGGLTARSYLDRARNLTGAELETHLCIAAVETVRANLEATGYPAACLHFVVGDVLDTLPEKALGSIAVLRLDTDWYESTRHELDHLFAKMSPGGVLICDDYNFWMGHRKAIDDYFADLGEPLLMCRIDSSAVIAVVSESAVAKAKRRVECYSTASVFRPVDVPNISLTTD
jgi:O-methyltransferase